MYQLFPHGFEQLGVSKNMWYNLPIRILPRDRWFRVAFRGKKIWYPLAFFTKGLTIHYSDVIMDAMASQITSLTIVYSTVYLGADQRKHQSFASPAFLKGSHRWPMNSPHKGPVTRKMFPFGDVIISGPRREGQHLRARLTWIIWFVLYCNSLYILLLFFSIAFVHRRRSFTIFWC